FHLHVAVVAELQFALGAFNLDRTIGDLHLDPAGDGNRLFADTRHARLLSLPHGAQQFAAELFGPRLAIAHHALTGAQDGNAESIKNRPQLIAVTIQPASRPAGP